MTPGTGTRRERRRRNRVLEVVIAVVADAYDHLAVVDGKSIRAGPRAHGERLRIRNARPEAVAKIGQDFGGQNGQRHVKLPAASASATGSVFSTKASLPPGAGKLIASSPPLGSLLDAVESTDPLIAVPFPGRACHRSAHTWMPLPYSAPPALVPSRASVHLVERAVGAGALFSVSTRPTTLAS
jgi:hypothetical protein